MLNFSFIMVFSWYFWAILLLLVSCVIWVVRGTISVLVGGVYAVLGWLYGLLAVKVCLIDVIGGFSVLMVLPLYS